jgi:ABC-type branched-subunit amino acid transport system ATPase component
VIIEHVIRLIMDVSDRVVVLVLAASSRKATRRRETE